jgi:hypothetical protein
MLGESLVGLRGKDSRKDVVARNRSDPWISFCAVQLLRKSPSISRFEKLSLAVLRLDNKSRRYVVV